MPEEVEPSLSPRERAAYHEARLCGLCHEGALEWARGVRDRAGRRDDPEPGSAAGAQEAGPPA